MPVCTRCGQSAQADVECCKACGGDVAAIGTYSGVAARSLDSRGNRDVARSHLRYTAWAEFRAVDPLSRQGPHRGQFRFQQPAGTAAFDQWPARTPPARGRQFRNDWTVAAQPPRPTYHDRGSSSYRPGRSGGTHHRRTGAFAATRAVLFIAGVVAIVLAVHYGAPSQTAADRIPTTVPRPARAMSASRPPLVANQVTVAPGAATARHEAAVVALLNRYFSAINNHAYRAYEKLFSPALRSGLSERTFNLGYGSTSDAAETVRSIAVIGAGQVEAIVTFTSHQQPAASPTQSSCTTWRMSLYLIRHGPEYLVAAPPDGYQPFYRSCS